MSIYVKPWFLDKKFREVSGGGWHLGERGPFNVRRETDKAVLIEAEASRIDGEAETVFTMWVPKSLTLTEEQFKAEEQNREERFNAGACGVKGVRKGMRMTTIKAKMQAAGVEIPD